MAAVAEETKKKAGTSKSEGLRRSTNPRRLRDEILDLEIHQILNILPHRFPFVMVDRVTEVLAHRYARGHKCVSYNEPFFPGHFPTRPVMPGTLVMEARRASCTSSASTT
jgi:hypothetical protein